MFSVKSLFFINICKCDITRKICEIKRRQKNIKLQFSKTNIEATPRSPQHPRRKSFRH